MGSFLYATLFPADFMSAKAEGASSRMDGKSGPNIKFWRFSCASYLSVLKNASSLINSIHHKVFLILLLCFFN